ncbi:hypothetical protein D9757_008647 [Collybiopsis confluens]|uniref:FHA domain-containing protein n=1 Tax=Collybiopsis confluens TaxID=2823264 RepID=A0A8H5H450_9AGAR|nr:hypothetical protein D9757_008647 [Collybiopsis confluens]
MWIVQGPFDVDPLTTSELKLRVLKPSKSYILGRKKTPYPHLIINSKKFSHEHCKFTVGEFTKDDAANPHKKPTLEITNLREKPLSIRRNGRRGEEDTVVVNNKMTVMLQEGDSIALVNGVNPLTIFWRFHFYLPRPNQPQLDACSALGVTISQTQTQTSSSTDSITPFSHHIAPTLTISPSSGLSLLSLASFVKIEWLNKFIEVYNTTVHNPNASSPSEMSTETPPDMHEPPLLMSHQYRSSFPSSSSSFDPKYKNMALWEPDQGRQGLFRGFKFLVLCEKDKDKAKEDNEMSLLRAFLSCGGGAVDTFGVSEGRTKFRQALKRASAKTDTTLVLVLVGENQRSVESLEEEAREYNLRFFTPTELVHAVLDVDTEVLKSVPLPPSGMDEEESQLGASHAPSSSFLPSYIPNSIPEEMTVPPPTAPRSLHDGSDLDEQEPEPEPQPLRRKPLPRRRKPPSMQVSAVPDAQGTADADANARSSGALESTTKDKDKDSEGEDQPPPPVPARRGVPIVTGLGDSSTVIDAAAAAAAAEAEVEVEPKTAPAPMATPMILDLSADPAPVRPSRPLKRRHAAAASAASSSSVTISASSATQEERPLKKYKALFEATEDPEQADALMSQLPKVDYLGSSGSGLESGQTQPSHTQSETQSGMQATSTRKSQAPRSRQTQLDAVPEEERQNETSSETRTQTQSRKRKVVPGDDEDNEDVEMAGVEDALAPSGTKSQIGSSRSRSRAGSVARPPPSKRQAIDDINAVERVGTVSAGGKENTTSTTSNKRSGTKTQGTGAAPGKPDTDPVFLKAVASTKKGKKHEDEFDREFNQLKISKPKTKGGRSGGGEDVQTQSRRNEEEEEQDWAGILNRGRDEFGFEDGTNVRGNFMVIVEMDVFRDRFPDADREREEREKESREKLAGVPNFKKFKKKNFPSKAKKINLYVSENQGYNLGNGRNDLSTLGGDRDLDAEDVSKDQDFDADDGDESHLSGTLRPKRSKPASSSRLQTQGNALVDDDSDEDGFTTITQTKSRKGSVSRASSVAASTRSTRATAGTVRSTRATKAATNPSHKSKPLFVDDSDAGSVIELDDMSDIEEVAEDEDEDMDDQTLPSTIPAKRRATNTARSTRSTKASSSKSKKQTPITVDSDSDEDAFKGFKKRR